MISWKAFHSALTAVLTAAIAVLAQITGMSGWAAVGLQTVAGVVFVGCAAVVVHEAPMFAAVPADGRAQIVRLLWVGVAVHLAWAGAYALRPDLWPVWLLVLLVLAVVAYWTARGHEYLLTQIVKAPIPTARAADPGAPVDQYTRVLHAALDRAGYAWLTVLRWASIGEPAFGIAVWVRVPSRMTLSQAGEKVQAALSIASAEAIAIGLSEVLRREILSDWVQIQKEPGAGTYKLVIVTEDVMGRLYPYRDVLQWSTITTPKLIGYGLDGRPVLGRLDQHGQVSGKSTSGKTSLVHVQWAEITKCSDAIIWCAGVEKLYDLVAGWIEPYDGTDLPLPIDWIASGQRDLLRMLVAAMTVARWRQRQPMSQRQGFTRIILYLDEASFALRNAIAKEPYQGVPRTAAELVAMISQGAASAGIFVRYISQRGVNSHFGDQGGDTRANAGDVAAFATKDAQDVGRLTGDYALPVPRHRGEFWYEAGDGPVRVKAPYIQEVDPSKPVLHGGPTIADVAWDRRAFVRTLDAGSAAAAGDAYASRHVRMDAAMTAYLTGEAAVDEPQPIEESPGYQEGRAMLEELGIGVPAQQAPPQPSGPELGGQVVTLAGRRTRADRIEEIVRQSPVPLSPAAIGERLAADGDHADPQTITNALTKLVRQGRLHRPERGLYRHG